MASMIMAKQAISKLNKFQENSPEVENAIVYDGVITYFSVWDESFDKSDELLLQSFEIYVESDKRFNNGDCSSSPALIWSWDNNDIIICSGGPSHGDQYKLERTLELP